MKPIFDLYAWTRYGFGMVLFAVLLIVGVVIGLCVGLDARSRGIKPAGIWGIVAALAPGFMGVIGYLIVRYFHDKHKETE